MSDRIRELFELLNVPFKFWTCPRGCGGGVVWSGDVAACKSCGLDSAGNHPKTEVAACGCTVNWGARCPMCGCP
jgi:hypothetical protein